MEAIGAASSALQILHTGLVLAASLYKIASDFKHAEDDFSTIAEEVRLTNMILDQARKYLLSNTLHYGLKEALESCGRIFNMIESAIKHVHRRETLWHLMAWRFKWSLYQKYRLATRRDDLEKSKSNLGLMLIISLEAGGPTTAYNRCQHCNAPVNKGKHLASDRMVALEQTIDTVRAAENFEILTASSAESNPAEAPRMSWHGNLASFGSSETLVAFCTSISEGDELQQMSAKTASD